MRVEKQRIYDHAQRLKSMRLRIDDHDPVVLCSLDYNAIGQLIRKRLHSNDGADRFAQEIDYRYHIRGWLTSINLSALTQPVETNKLFSMELIYNDKLNSLSNVPQFNGNVSAVRWRNISSNEEQAYVYKYDGFDRLESAQYQVDGPKRGAFNESTIEYDPNGNLRALSRNGFISSERLEIDRLVYTYSGNQLRSVRDTSGRNEGFHDAGLEGDAYEYDSNGSMAADRNKGIQISYNPLNLIDEIRKESGESVRFGFDADGLKCFREVFGPGGTSRGRLDYVGDCVFEDGVLRLVMHDEGRIVRNSEEGGWRFQYFLYDYLGNVRVAFEVRTDDSEGNTTPINAVVYAADYYPFGLPIDGNGGEEGGGTAVKHLFGGKELQEVMGLQWYDFGARMLDPSLGRWFVLDPDAEKHYGITPYGYALNNPIRYVDPTGLGPNDFKYAVLQGMHIQNQERPGSWTDEEIEFYHQHGYQKHIDERTPEQVANDRQIFLEVMKLPLLLGVSLIPPFGEAMDAAVLTDPEATLGEKSAAGASLAGSAVSSGATPNAGAVLLGTLRGRKAAKLAEKATSSLVPGGGGKAGGGWVRVSRRMSPEEAKLWKGRSSVLPPRSSSGDPPRTAVTGFGDPAPAGGVGPVRVDFDVPAGAAEKGGVGYFILGGRYIPIKDLIIPLPK